MEAEIFTFIGDTVTNATEAFVGPAAGELITELQGVALIMVTLYIFLMGASIVMGTVQAPIQRVLTQWFKIVVILALALTSDNYATYVVDAFEGLEAGLADVMNVGGTGATSIYQVLDQTVAKGVELASLCLKNADDAGWNFGSVAGWWLAAVVIAFGTAMVAVFGGATLIVAKFALAIMFAFGPFFFLLLLFPVTAKFFSAWFSQVMNYTLLVVIVAVIMAFAMAAFGALIGAADLSGAGEVNPLMASVQIFILSFVLVFILSEARGMAAGLAGGLSMSAMTISHILTPARVARNAADPVSTRRDLQSGMLTTARRSNHLVAGNTIANPAYLQNVKQNAMKNWGMSKGGRVKS